MNSIRSCVVGGKPGYKVEGGKCNTYDVGDEVSKKKARTKTEKQLAKLLKAKEVEEDGSV